MQEISLALGGGGIKGIAHIGVLQELERNGFSIKAVAGTSAGGLVGSVFSAGVPLDRIIEIVNRMDQKSLFARDSKDGPSILGLKGLTNLLIEVLGNKTFEDLILPFACTAVDIKSSQEYILHEGRLIDAVLSTIAIPGVFPPRKINNAELVDGGVLDPVPVTVARWLHPSLPVVAICLSAAPQSVETFSPSYRLPIRGPIPAPIIEYFARLRLSQALQTFLDGYETSSLLLADLRLQVDKPEVIIRPEVSQYGTLDIVNPQELIEIGRKSVQDALPQIQESLNWSKSLVRRFRKVETPGKLSGFTDDTGSNGYSE